MALSTSLAVIALATALKDACELANKLGTQLGKASANLRDLKGFVEEIAKSMSDLKEICDESSAELDRNPSFKKDVDGLLLTFHEIHAQVIGLIQLPSPQLLQRLADTIFSKKNDSVRERIRELKDEFSNCCMRYTLKRVTRADIATNQLLQVLKVHRLGVVARTQDPLAATAGISNLIASAQTSSSASTARGNNPVAMGPIQWASDNQLITWINQIDVLLRGISSTDATRLGVPLEANATPFAQSAATSFRPELLDRESLYRDVVMRALELLNVLENQPTTTPTQELAWSLLSLSIGLHYLRMKEQATLICMEAVKLFRALVGVHKLAFSPYLIHSLVYLSRCHQDGGNMPGAMGAIGEAGRLSQELQELTPSVEITVQYAGVLLESARKRMRIKRDNKGAIEYAQRAVRVLKHIIITNTDPVQCDTTPPSMYYTRMPSDAFQNVPIGMLTFDGVLATYARAARELSNFILAGPVSTQMTSEALHAKLDVLTIFERVSKALGEEMDTELAGILYELISQKCKSLLTPEKLLEYADDCVKIYRRHTDLNASMYGRCLCDALWEKANALNTLSKDSEALEVWIEIAEIAQKMMQDQVYYAKGVFQVCRSFRRLRRHEEAASTRIQLVLTYEAINGAVTSSQADGHYNLCVDYQLAKKFPEAVEAATKAVEQYRALVFIEPEKWNRQIGQALSALAKSLFSAGKHEAALNVGHESMLLFEQHIKTDKKWVQAYISALWVNIHLAIGVKNERKGIKRIERVMGKLAVKFPKWAVKILCALITKWAVSKRTSVDRVAFDMLHRITLNLLGNIFSKQGSTKLALVAIRIGKVFSNISPVLAGKNLGFMSECAHLLVELGRYNEALVVAHEALKLNRETIGTRYVHNQIMVRLYNSVRRRRLRRLKAC